ncbi:hypothetical protein H0H92_007187, partial [Tricholoma furcatifolium]
MFDMLDIALQYCKAVDQLTNDRKNKLREFELSDRVLKDATTFFSHSVPNLATVIPAMDLIDHELTKASLDTKNNSALRAAIGIAKKTANRYYTKTDDSELYRAAMTNLWLVLHPSYKLEYFADNNWPTDWIDATKDIVRNLFDKDYQLEVEDIALSDDNTSERRDFDMSFDVLNYIGFINHSS